MKTPRDILLARHKSIEPKLGDLRQSAVAAVYDRRPAPPWTSLMQNIWQELILPSRRIWTGLAAIWLFLLIANFSMRNSSPVAIANARPSPQMMLAFRQQQQLMSELLNPTDVPVAEPRKPYAPRPNSQRDPETITA